MKNDTPHSDRAMVGQPILRREDERLIRGAGRYTADIQPDKLLHVAFVRSTMPRSTILECDVEEALDAPGVDAVFTGRDVGHLGNLSISPLIEVSGTPVYPILAEHTVAAVGQPVAAVVAASSSLASDAADYVMIDLDEAPESEDEPVTVNGRWESGDVDAAFEEADHIVSATVSHSRLAPSPMEPRAITVEFDSSDDSVTVWLSTQTPHRARLELAKILCVCETKIRVVAPDVGGAFGMKAALYPEDVLVVWAAFRLKKSVQWVASRSEEFLSATHGRGCRSQGELAVSADGRFLAVKSSMALPLGHWLPTSAVIPAWNAGRIIPSGYDIQTLKVTSIATATDTAAVGIYRGAGRPEANSLMERLVDEAAAVTGIDPLDIRLQNVIGEDQFPYRTASGYELDSGRYGEALKKLADRADYVSMKRRRDKRRAEGELVGIGLGFYVEPCGIGWESARITLHPDGRVVAATGGSSQGHGRETALAQIVADGLNVPMNTVEVRHGDTRSCPTGIGALASRSTAIGGSAMAEVCQKINRRVKNGDLSSGPVTEEINYENDGEAWGYGCYLIELSIDGETGVIEIESANCIDDVGTIINPLLVEGQIMGGFAQGIGEALLEELKYDEYGQLLTGSLTDYALPRADNIPKLSISKLVTPSPNNTLGAKGVGEAGTIGAPAAILNAAIDALRPIGVTSLEMPLTSHRIWQAINNAITQENR
ncbi:MAG: xanthine dehydrogenase family protein molybdopterin-binding subunit [Gammaproteobacteria bacterium]